MSDICHNRHGGNPYSNEANLRANKEITRQRIIEYLSKYGQGYSKEISRHLNKPLNTISGRFSELRADNLIEPTGEKREGCAVYQLTMRLF